MSGRAEEPGDPGGGAPGEAAPDGDGGSRRFLVWMQAPEYPGWHLPPEGEGRIREALGEAWELVRLAVPVEATGDGVEEAPPRLLEEIRDAEVYCGFGLPREGFLAAERLRWVHSGAAGVGGTLYPEMRESDVLLTSSAGVYAEPMAEHVLAMIHHFARGLDVAAAGMSRGEWRHADLARRGRPQVELEGRVAGVLGYGRAGRAVGRRAAALGMRVWATRRTPGDEPPPEVERMLGPAGTGEVLEAADFLVLTLPGTPETRGLIGTEELARMKETAVLVNVGRGEAVDEDALARALRDGELRGAGLDVFREEPLPPSSPLWALENVLVTPHVAGQSPRYWERELDLIEENIRRYRAGEPLRNRVDESRGY